MSALARMSPEALGILQRTPGRCSACGGHLATQGHVTDCPLGPRSWMSLQPDGTLLHNPPGPPPEPEPDKRYGPHGTTLPRGNLPEGCTRCGDYSSHSNHCPGAHR